VEGRGVDDVLEAIDAHRSHLERTGGIEIRRERRIRDELRGIVLDRLTEQADAICHGPRFDSVVRRVAQEGIDPYTAALELVGAENEREE
jgi:LAO/AO transport system kinase